MQIIKDKQIVEDNWQFSDDNSPLRQDDTTISLQRWLTNKDELITRQNSLGLRLTSTDELDSIETDINNFPLIELYFNVFTDGRSFSQAKLLRDRYQYTGEIRATGNFLRDQINYLSKVGFNSFQLENDENLEGAATALDEFSVQYQ